jgi:hypothetical protein
VIKLRWKRRSGHVARIGEMRNVYKIFVGKSEESEILTAVAMKSSITDVSEEHVAFIFRVEG